MKSRLQHREAYMCKLSQLVDIFQENILNIYVYILHGRQQQVVTKRAFDQAACGTTTSTNEINRSLALHHPLLPSLYLLRPQA